MRRSLRQHRAGVEAVTSLVLGMAAAHHALRRAERRWVASVEESTAPFPGDEAVAEPVSEITRAITIEAPAEEVWPWIAQLGADRGGFYSYTWLENLFGLGIRNADRVVPEWQERSVGDLVLADRAGTGGWYVVAVKPPHALAMAVADVGAGRPLRRNEGLRWEFLWTFALRELPGGRCRLLVRERTAFGSRWTRVLMAPIGHVSFLMTRQMMLGIQARAEGTWLMENLNIPAPAATG